MVAIEVVREGHMEDVPTVDEIPSQPNDPVSLVDQFAWLDSMDGHLISYGEQFWMLNSRIGNLDDRLYLVGDRSRETHLGFSCCIFGALMGYHFASDMDDTPWQNLCYVLFFPHVFSAILNDDGGEI